MNNKEKPIRIDVGLTGSVRLIDVDAFFEQDKVKNTIKRMSEMDIVGKKLNGNITHPKNKFSKKPSENSK